MSAYSRERRRSVGQALRPCEARAVEVAPLLVSLCYTFLVWDKCFWGQPRLGNRVGAYLLGDRGWVLRPARQPEEEEVSFGLWGQLRSGAKHKGAVDSQIIPV